MAKEKIEKNLEDGNTANPIPGPEEAKPKAKKIEVEESTLKTILANQEKLQSVIDRQQSDMEKLLLDNKKLMEVADKGRLEAWDRLNSSGEIIRRASLRTWGKDIILGWKMIQDEVAWIGGVERATQILKLFLFNGEGKEPKEVEVSLVDFNRNYRLEGGDIINTSKTPGKLDVYTIQLKDGRKFPIEVTFIN